MTAARRFALALMALLVVVQSAAAAAPSAEPRFPRPQFRSGYETPTTPTPAPRPHWRECLDLAVLAAALAAAGWLALTARSRRGLFLLMVFSVLYFGFWRRGCICAIGSLQNVSLALGDPGYVLPPVAAAFFVLPLVAALFFGRTFCAGVCPLGGVQDAVVLRPVRVPPPLEHALGLFPYLYLGVAVLLAAGGAGFFICRYDPFVSIFRMGGHASVIAFGGALLLLGTVVARPYCRYLCPYGVLLRWMSVFSRKHVTVTPDECVECRLCSDACPFGAILPPSGEKPRHVLAADRKALAVLLPLAPVVVAAGAWLGSAAHGTLSLAHPRVALAERLRLEESGAVSGTTLESDAFRGGSEPAASLLEETRLIRRRLRLGGGLLGAFLGAVFVGKLIGLCTGRVRKGYEPDRGKCLSCGRCFLACPVEHVRRFGTAQDYDQLKAAVRGGDLGAIRASLPEGEVIRAIRGNSGQAGAS